MDEEMEGVPYLLDVIPLCCENIETNFLILFLK